MQDVVASKPGTQFAVPCSFCAVAPNGFGWTQQILAAMDRWCIPVLVMEHLLQPTFDHEINWMQLSVKWDGPVDASLLDALQSISPSQVAQAMSYMESVRFALGSGLLHLHE
jgi:hypothetical protein